MEADSSTDWNDFWTRDPLFGTSPDGGVSSTTFSRNAREDMIYTSSHREIRLPTQVPLFRAISQSLPSDDNNDDDDDESLPDIAVPAQNNGRRSPTPYSSPASSISEESDYDDSLPDIPPPTQNLGHRPPTPYYPPAPPAHLIPHMYSQMFQANGIRVLDDVMMSRSPSPWSPPTSPYPSPANSTRSPSSTPPNTPPFNIHYLCSPDRERPWLPDRRAAVLILVSLAIISHYHR